MSYHGCGRRSRNCSNKLIYSYNGERCIRPTAERCWPPVKEKYLKRRRPYPTRYALKVRDEVRDKVRATIESSVKKTFPNSLVVSEDIKCDCGNGIEY